MVHTYALDKHTIIEFIWASVSRIDKIIGLFCKRALQKRLYSAKGTYNFIDPTDCSHPIIEIISSILCVEEGQGGRGWSGRGGGGARGGGEFLFFWKN